MTEGLAVKASKLKNFAPYAMTGAFFVMLLILVNSDLNWVSDITSNYLPVHIVLEFIGILVSFAIFTVGWATYQNARETDILVLSVASFAVGALDLGHTLSFTGMPDFVGPSGPNKAISFWLASRLIGSLAFLYVAMAKPRTARFKSLQWLLLSLSVVYVAACYFFILFRPADFPTFFVQGEGLKPIKIVAEWFLVGVSIVAGLLLISSAKRGENLNIRWIAAASLLYGMCGYFFTIYRDFDDIYNFCGHVYKAFSYIILYRAVFVECVSRPYEHVKLLAAEAEASSLSKSRFLANVSHEFRTPLGVIAGFSELLANSGKLDDQLKKWAMTITRNSKQLSLLIDDLLDLAKADTANIELRKSLFDLSVLVSQVCEGLEMQAQRGVKIRIENALGADTNIVTDEMRLRQILVNIIGNAIKFTSKGEVVIRLGRARGDCIEIDVEDSGIGIQEQDTLRLFQPFSQVSNPSERRFAGTGLGLSLSLKLAQLLGGSLALKWSRPGDGSCFAFYFKDYAIELAEPASEPASKPAAPELADRKILVAEDSEDNRFLIQSYLAPTGIDIVFAENGRIAVDIALSNKFDMILMDIQMPVMDGFEATSQLRAKKWLGPIVALTAHALQPEKERAMRNGFTQYLVKPIQKEDLWAAVAYQLRR